MYLSVVLKDMDKQHILSFDLKDLLLSDCGRKLFKGNPLKHDIFCLCHIKVYLKKMSLQYKHAEPYFMMEYDTIPWQG